MSKICYEGCLHEFDSQCIEYTGEPLGNLEVDSGDILEEILVKLNELAPSQLTFIASSNNTIAALGGGVLGHSPAYAVRINPSSNNLISVSTEGLFVPPGQGGDGKSKVDEDDDKDYLESQFSGDSDGILTVTPIVESGKIKFMPTFDVEMLLNIVEALYQTEFCEAIEGC